MSSSLPFFTTRFLFSVQFLPFPSSLMFPFLLSFPFVFTFCLLALFLLPPLYFPRLFISPLLTSCSMPCPLLPFLLLFHLLSSFRGAVRPRQQGELHRRPGGRYGRLHGLLGQLPQTVELRHPSGGKHWERERRRRKSEERREGGAEERKINKETSEAGGKRVQTFLSFPPSLLPPHSCMQKCERFANESRCINGFR